MSPEQSIAHYRITGKLGEGGMGAVYRATDTKLNREVAIKVLPDTFAADPDRLARFTREAQVLAQLNHPNIAAIYGVEDRALVMELIEGPAPSGPLSAEELLPLLHQLIDALEYAHDKGVVHRDLKPANLKLTSDGRLKVLDFGLAKALTNETAATTNPADSPTLTMRATMAGVIMGTAAYMSPEQARGHHADRRSDIWSFGVVVYELLTGRQLFNGPSVSDVLAAVLTQTPDLSAVPPRFHRLLKMCLARDPNQRLSHISGARLLLEEAPPVAASTPAARRSWLPWAVAILALATAGSLAFVHFREQAPSTPVTRFAASFPGENIQDIAISPDGRQFVAVTHVIGQITTHLTLRSLDTLETRVLPGTEGATLPFWSPDNRYIGFGDQNRLKFTDTHGGLPQTLAEVPMFRGGTWNSSGVILYAGSSAILQQIRSNGGTPSKMMESRKVYFPIFLPDQRHFLFISPGDTEETGGIFVGSLDPRDAESQNPRRILGDLSRAIVVPAGNGREPNELALLFVRDNNLMGVPFDAKTLRPSGDVYLVGERVARSGILGSDKFSASSTGTLLYVTQEAGNRRLTWYDRQGKVSGTIDEAGMYRSASLSPDGTRLAVDREIGSNSDIWVYDLGRTSKIHLTSGSGAELNPVWSPDGQWIAYNAGNENYPSRVLRKAATGTGAEETLADGRLLHLYDWSRDGKYMLVASAITGSLRDLFALPLEGDRSLVPLVQTNSRDDQGKFSPDGKFFAYKSNETGRDEIYVQPFPPGAGNERWTISGGGGTMPRWSRDGKELYFIAQGKLMVAPVQTAPAFSAGLPRELFKSQIAGEGGFAFVCWDLTPDAKKFIFITEDAAPQAPLTVVLNWPAGLRK